MADVPGGLCHSEDRISRRVANEAKPCQRRVQTFRGASVPQGLSDVIRVEYEDVLRTDRVGDQSGRSSPAKLAKPFGSAAIKGYEYTKHLRPRGRSVFHTSAAGPVLSALDASTLRCLCCVAAPQVLTVARSSKADGKYYGWLEQLV